MASVTADISLDGLVLNGRAFHFPVEPAEYATTLQMPVRVVEPSPPAPYSHRNNQIHVYDELGLYLIEHHGTRLIDAVVFVLWLEEATFKPSREFVGALTIGGVRFFKGMTERDHFGGTIKFEGPDLGLWKASRGGVWIGFTGKGRRYPSGRRGKLLRFVDVSICFSAPHNSVGRTLRK
jgi:hypothetical protein